MPRKSTTNSSGVAKRNFNHALMPCSDPDCEIHHPAVIEERPQRLTAMAWYIAGVMAAQQSVNIHNNQALGQLVTNLREADKRQEA